MGMFLNSVTYVCTQDREILGLRVQVSGNLSENPEGPGHPRNHGNPAAAHMSLLAQK